MDARSRIAYRDYQILETVSQDNPSLDNPACVAPQGKWEMLTGALRLPHFSPAVARRRDIVAVDYELPGCPPQADRVCSSTASASIPAG